MGKREEAIGHYNSWLGWQEKPKMRFYNLDTRSPAIGLGYLPIMPDGRLRTNLREHFEAAGRPLSEKEYAALTVVARGVPTPPTPETTPSAARQDYERAVGVLGQVSLSRDQMDGLSAAVYDEYAAGVRRALGDKGAEIFDSLDPARQAALVRLVYRRGEGGFADGVANRGLADHLKTGNWDKAAQAVMGIPHSSADRSRFEAEAEIMRDPSLKGFLIAEPRHKTLGQLASEYRTKPEDLVAANPGLDPNRFRPGQLLVQPWGDKDKRATAGNSPQAAFNRTLFTGEAGPGIAVEKAPPLPEIDKKSDLDWPGRENDETPRFAGLPQPVEPEGPVRMAWEPPGREDDNPFAMLFHKGGAVPADGDPRTDACKAIVQEGEFVLAPVTTQAVDPDLVAAMNAMASGSPERAAKLRAALAAILGDGPALSEEALKKRLAGERDYWRSGPEGDARRWRYATEYRFAFPDDQDGRTARQDGGLVSDGDWARRQEGLPARLPEGGFVFSRNAVRAFGANLLGRLNAAGLVENAPALTEVRRAIAEAMGRRLKLTPKELKALQMDPRSWRDLDRRYIDSVADEYRFAYGE